MIIRGKKIYFLIENYSLWPIDIYNGPAQVYYIKPEGEKKLLRGLILV